MTFLSEQNSAPTHSHSPLDTDPLKTFTMAGTSESKVDVKLKLDLDFSAVGVEGSLWRDGFNQDLKQDLAKGELMTRFNLCTKLD